MTIEELWHSSPAVLFDFDGVLADSEPLYRRSWNRVLDRYGHMVPEKDYWKHWSFLGEGLQGEMERHGLNIPAPGEAIARQKQIYTDYCLSGRIPLFPLAVNVLSLVMSRKPCAIASNTDGELVRRILRNAEAPELLVIGGNGLRPKPFPDIFLKASAELGFFPGDCLVFEDAQKGVRAGVSAGMSVVLVRNRYNKGLAAPGATLEIDGLEELFMFLKGLEC